jgi:hypothetical protein
VMCEQDLCTALEVAGARDDVSIKVAPGRDHRPVPRPRVGRRPATIAGRRRNGTIAGWR